MKAGRIIRYVLFSVVLCLLSGAISSANASLYLGEFCFQSQIDGAIYRLAITDMGDEHFLVNGKVYFPASGAFTPLHGNAEAGPGFISITLTGGSLLNNGTEAFTINFDLDMATLGGSGEGIVTQDISASISTFASSDTVDFVVCP